VYGFHKSDNAELRLRFYRSALKSGPEYAQKAAGTSDSTVVVSRGYRGTACRGEVNDELMRRLGHQQGPYEVLPAHLQVD
jgi:hypothetical protein